MAMVEWLRRTGGRGTTGDRDRSLIESVSRLLNSLPELGELTQRAMELAVEQFDAERGVLLLNRVLTVQPGHPASHRGKGWEQVTEQAIRALVAREGEPLVAILWGRDARTLVPLLGDVPSIESAHPSPNSAHNGFFGSRPFSRANHLLEELGGEPLDWKLP